MSLWIDHELAQSTVADRRAQAAVHNRAARLRTARRLQRRAETATRRAQLARLAVR